MPVFGQGLVRELEGVVTLFLNILLFDVYGKRLLTSDDARHILGLDGHVGVRILFPIQEMAVLAEDDFTQTFEEDHAVFLIDHLLHQHLQALVPIKVLARTLLG